MSRYTIICIASLVSGVASFTSGSLAQLAGSDTQFITAQPPNEFLARVFIGSKVQAKTGETIGNVNDVMFDQSGRITTIVLGVGGFLGVGEKNVAVPFSKLTITISKDGGRVLTVPLSVDNLKQAPVFSATEKTAMDSVEEKAIELGKKTSEKAGQIKDQALKKLDEMKKDEPSKP